MFNIENYVKPNGTIPVEEHLDSLPIKMRIKIMANIELLRKKGNMLRMPYTESLTDGIYELRTKLGSDIERVFFFFLDERKIILTHGFIKKTQKTPPAEIRRAKKYRADYLNSEKK